MTFASNAGQGQPAGVAFGAFMARTAKGFGGLSFGEFCSDGRNVLLLKCQGGKYLVHAVHGTRVQVCECTKDNQKTYCLHGR